VRQWTETGSLAHKGHNEKTLEFYNSIIKFYFMGVTVYLVVDRYVARSHQT
jgi:hypothetical protein